MRLDPGSRLESYEIIALLGSGGMGEVYRARDPRIGRDVAIKILPPSFATDRDRLRRFDTEARAVRGSESGRDLHAVLDTPANGKPRPAARYFAHRRARRIARPPLRQRLCNHGANAI